MQDRAFSQYSKTFSKALVNYRPILKFKDFQGFQRTLRTLKEASKYEVFKELVIDESTFGLISVAQRSNPAIEYLIVHVGRDCRLFAESRGFCRGISGFSGR